MRKFSGIEWASLVLCALCVVCSVGWLSSGSGRVPAVRVERHAIAAKIGDTAVEPPASSTAQPEPSPSSAVPSAGMTGKININTAGLEELQTLPGIGEKRAQAIVDDREANGPFRIPEDLTRVSGIGEGILANIIDSITVE